MQIKNHHQPPHFFYKNEMVSKYWPEQWVNICIEPFVFIFSFHFLAQYISFTRFELLDPATLSIVLLLLLYSCCYPIYDALQVHIVLNGIFVYIHSTANHCLLSQKSLQLQWSGLCCIFLYHIVCFMCTHNVSNTI